MLKTCWSVWTLVLVVKKYRIERGRKPNVLRFYVDNQEQEATDNAQGDSRETQAGY